MALSFTQGYGRRARQRSADCKLGRMLALSGMVLALGACGLSVEQRDAVRQFSLASNSFGTVTAGVVEALPARVAQVNMYDLALTPDKDKIDFDGPFNERDVAARVKAAKTIQEYGALLLALVDANEAATLQKAGGKFTASVRSLDENQVLSDDQLDSIGKIIVGIGGLWIDRQAAEALKQIVPATDPQIAKLGDLFAGEFNKDGPVPEYMDARAFQLEKNAGKALEGKVQPGDRFVGSEALRLAGTTIRETNTVYPPIADAAMDMVAAHGKMVTALQTGDVSFASIRAFAKRVEDLAAAAAVFAGS
ncbi:MAG: hypothetical protein GY791_20675 [Alphaproteobacteria bacterium]|nr:hypothetical protein [Alphaproteobacteria bacterium]